MQLTALTEALMTKSIPSLFTFEWRDFTKASTLFISPLSIVSALDLTLDSRETRIALQYLEGIQYFKTLEKFVGP